MTKETIEFKDWEKLDLRVAKIMKVEEIEGADKLWKLELDVGDLGKRIICAGIKEHYSKEELVGKKIIYFLNLLPRKMRGVESQGMLLAASAPKGVPRETSEEVSTKGIVLISPEIDIEVGSIVG